MSNEQQLQDLRARIDELDGQLLQMITTRAELAKAVAGAKGGEANDYYRPEREAQVLRKIISRNRGPLSDEEMARLFREIMSACLALQQPLNVGFLGPEGTFTHAAVQKHFGRSVQALPMGTIDDVFREVEAEACHYGVVPVENSIEGVVNHTLDMFINSPLRICGEVELRIHHHLLGKAANPDGLMRVYGHEQALAQCRRWLTSVLPDAVVVPALSTAEAASTLADGTGSHDAAVAAPIAAERYRLEVLATDIEDNPDAVTRFVLVGRPGQPPMPSGHDKTTLVAFISDDHAGALLEVLTEFAVRGVNLTRIESRPTGEGMGRYCFSLDCEGHVDDARVGEALTGLRRVCADVRFLGSYPRHDNGPAAEESSRVAKERDSVYRDAAAWLGRIRNGKL